MTENEKDVYLLDYDTNVLLEKYQDIIKIIVNRNIKKGIFSRNEKEDIVQNINEKLLCGKLEKIKDQYNSQVYLKTYFSKIVYNMCLEIYRKKKGKFNNTDTIDIDCDELGNNSNTESKLTIQDEISRFGYVMKMYGKTRFKLELCLKIISGIKIKKDDFTSYHSNKTNELIVNMVKRLNNSVHNLSEKEIYELVIPYFNQCEDKNNSADSLRRWIQLKIIEIIDIMNGNPKQSNYNKETLKILIQKCYE